MDFFLRERLRKEIEVYKAKFPTARCPDVIRILKQGDTLSQLFEVKPDTLAKFVRYQLTKFDRLGYVIKHAGGNGRKEIARTIESRIM